jgi:nicotinamidase-related amidase
MAGNFDALVSNKTGAFLYNSSMPQDKHAILVIDVQNGFVTDKTKSVPKRIADRIQSHPYDHVLFSQFINQPNSNYERVMGITSCYSPPDTDIHPDLAAYITRNNVFVKHGKSAFKNQTLLDYLKQHQIKQIDLCGLDIDDCVLATAFEAFDLNLDFQILDDLCGSSHGQEHVQSATQAIINKNLSQQNI